jgi:hypothetical protein
LAERRPGLPLRRLGAKQQALGASTAPSWMSRAAWAYVVSVMLVLACPSRSLTTFTNSARRAQPRETASMAWERDLDAFLEVQMEKGNAAA